MITASIPTIISRYAEEAALLWLTRRAAIASPHYSLADLARLDERVEAHLDGLRIAGDEGWKICEEELSWEDAGEVFTGAVLAFETSIPARIEGVLKVVVEKPDLIDGVISALGWLSLEQAKPHIQALLPSPAPALQRAALAGAAVHRMTSSDLAARFTRTEDSPLRARSLKAIGELARADLLPAAQQALPTVDPSVRFAACWSIVLLTGDKAALNVLSSFAEAPGPLREKAMELFVRRLDLPTAKAWRSRLSRDSATRSLAIQAAGAIGDPEPIPWLIDDMRTASLARVAGEAFTMITGLDMEVEHLDGKMPEGFEAGPNDNPADENVAMDEDENLPWPNPELIQKWWQKNRGQFQNGTRYLLGKPMTIEWLQQVLRIGRQRQRAAAALELAIRQPGTPLFNVAAPGFRQQEMLGLKRTY